MSAITDNAGNLTQPDNIEVIEVNAHNRPQDICDVTLSLNLIYPNHY